jgi:hypothetical protein
MKVMQMTAKKKPIDNSPERKPEAGDARGAGAGRRLHRKKLTPHAREAQDAEAMAAKFPRYRMVKTEEPIPLRQQSPEAQRSACVVAENIEARGLPRPARAAVTPTARPPEGPGGVKQVPGQGEGAAARPP